MFAVALLQTVIAALAIVVAITFGLLNGGHLRAFLGLPSILELYTDETNRQLEELIVVQLTTTMRQVDSRAVSKKGSMILEAYLRRGLIETVAE